MVVGISFYKIHIISMLLDKIAECEWYFRPRPFEKKIYEAIGIKKSKKVISWIGKTFLDKWEKKERKEKNNYFLWDYSLQGLKEFEKRTRFNEIVHSPLLSLLIFFIIIYYSRYGYYHSLCFVLPFLINIYLNLLQRYNRVRIYDCIKKKKVGKEIL